MYDKIMIAILLMLCFLASCAFQQDVANQEEAVPSPPMVGNIVYIDEIPLKENTLAYSFLFHKKFVLDGPISRVRASATPVGQDSTAIEIYVESCFEGQITTCKQTRESVTISGQDSLLALIQNLKEVPRKGCKALSVAKSYNIYGRQITFIDENGQVSEIQDNHCSISEQSKDSLYIETRVCNYFLDKPVVSSLLPKFEYYLTKESSDSAKVFVLDTMLTRKNSIFFPWDGIVAGEGFVADSVRYCQLEMRGDSVLYNFNLKNSSGEFFKKQMTDGDTSNFKKFKRLLEEYSTEMFESSYDKRLRTIFFSDSSMKRLIFSNLNDSTNISRLEQMMREWLESKLSE